MKNSEHPLYWTWLEMRKRCFGAGQKSKSASYKKRGISICKEWDDFWQFVKDMGPRPEGTSLDRINNDGDYEPTNCRWATNAVQMRNTCSNHYIEFNGERLCVTDWAKRLGVRSSAVHHRIRRHGEIQAIAMGPKKTP